MEHQEHAMHAGKSVRRYVNVVSKGCSQRADYIVSVTRVVLYVLLLSLMAIVD